MCTVEIPTNYHLVSIPLYYRSLRRAQDGHCGGAVRLEIQVGTELRLLTPKVHVEVRIFLPYFHRLSFELAWIPLFALCFV
jgi:hypothetical protein